jgi:hypothetical protein
MSRSALSSARVPGKNFDMLRIFSSGANDLSLQLS